MAALNEEKFKQMQDEMSRFEEEIGLPLPDLAPPPPIPILPSPGPKVISTSTYNEAQKQLAGLDTLGAPLVIPPPPPPPPLPFIPHQVRGVPPRPSMDGGRPPIDWRGPLPPGPMPPGPPLPPGPPMQPSGPLPPPPFAMMGLGPGPMGPGPMPPGPGPMSAMSGPGGMGPGGPMMPPNFNGSGFPPHMNQQRFNPPAPQESKPQPSASVLSATPMMYVANPQLEIAAIQAETHPVQVSQPELPMEDTKKNTKKASKSQEGVTQVTTVTGSSKKDKKRNKKLVRTAGGQTWEDPTLGEWEDDDFRLFCGDLGNDVTDEVLTRAFSKYPSFLKARVVRDKRTNKTKGFGFVSFKDPQDFIRATKEMNGRYVGSRPIKLRKSTWKNRALDVVRKKEKEKQQLIALLTGK